MSLLEIEHSMDVKMMNNTLDESDCSMLETSLCQANSVQAKMQSLLSFKFHHQNTTRMFE